MARLLYIFFIFCHFIYSLNAQVRVIISPPSPLEFKTGQPRTLSCQGYYLQPPITFQWIRLYPTYNESIPNSNHSAMVFTFIRQETGNIVCQAKGRYDARFFNSTPVYFHVKLAKGVWIAKSEPIHFKVNRTKSITCKTEGLTPPIVYQWVNVTNSAVFQNSNAPTLTFTFHQVIKKGKLQCQARGVDDRTFYVSSSKNYYVSAETRVAISFVTLAIGLIGIFFL